MSSGGGSSHRRLVVCAACMKTFKRLAGHLSQSPACNLLYTTSHDPKREIRQIDSGRLACNVAALPTAHAGDEISSNDEEFDMYDEVSSNDEDAAEDEEVSSNDDKVSSNNGKGVRGNEEVSSDDEEALDDDEDVAVEDFAFPSDGDDEVVIGVEDEVSSNDEEVPGDDEVDSEGNTETGAPDTSVLELYHLLTTLRSNPLELARFSQEEQVYISLLQILKEIKAPLNAFGRILTWAAKSNKDGHQFQSDNIPTREKIIENLYARYNMKGLIPKEAFLFLPYTKRVASFDDIL